MRTWFMIAILASVALAGCAESGDAPADIPVDETSEDNPEGLGNETVEDTNETADEAGENVTEEAENLVPVLTVTADAVNGTAPLVVNFTLSVDDDSDDFAWTFFVGDNETLTGTEVPASFNHTFDEGVWNVTVELTDGEHTVNETFQVVSSVDVPDPVLEEFTCTTTAGAGGSSLTGPGISIGGCALTSISAPRIVHEVAPAASCRIMYNSDGDTTFDGEAVVGTEYPGSTDFTATCDVGAVEAESRLVLEVPVA